MSADDRSHLQRAATAMGEGRHATAARILTGLLERQPRHGDALQLLGLCAYHLGHAEEALTLMDQSLALDRRQPAVVCNRSLPLMALGRLDEAQATLRRALRLRPRFPAARVRLAEVLLARGEARQAQLQARRALEEHPGLEGGQRVLAAALLAADQVHAALDILEPLARRRPQDVGIQVQLAAARGLDGDLRGAAAAWRQVMALEPHHPKAALGLAGALLGLGQWREAEAQARQAVQQGEEDGLPLLSTVLRSRGQAEEALDILQQAAASPAVWRARGLALRALGRHEESIAALEQAWDLTPDGETAHLLAQSWLSLGEPEQALGWAQRSLSVETATPARLVTLAEIIAVVPDPAAVDEALALACLAHDAVDTQALERWLRGHLELQAPLAAALDPGPAEWGPAASSGTTETAALQALEGPLSTALLRRTIVRCPRWEALLTGLRGWLVAQEGRLDRWRQVAVSLAIQAHHQGFAWHESPAEQEQARLTQAALATQGQQAWNHDPEQVLGLALYRPLAQALPVLADAPMADPHLDALVQVHLREPRREAALAPGLATLRLGSDPTSLAVRQQYEEHPYPRLVGVHRKAAAPLAQVVAASFPSARLEGLPAKGGRVLVAGCGTGHSLLAVATRYRDVQVVGLDLSRRSLALAARKLEQWGLGSRVSLLQADILELGDWSERFNLVVAGGVLHHLARPESGWRILAGLLRPGGLMELGLYSQASRGVVYAGRELAARRGWQPSPQGIRQARREILSLPAEHPAWGLRFSPDFYSQGGFRDLVLHVSEQGFTIPRLERAMGDLGLRFLGFQFPVPQVKALYRERFPHDPLMLHLQGWQALEQEQPHIFAGMYQLWCQRR